MQHNTYVGGGARAPEIVQLNNIKKTPKNKKPVIIQIINVMKKIVIFSKFSILNLPAVGNVHHHTICVIFWNSKVHPFLVHAKLPLLGDWGTVSERHSTAHTHGYSQLTYDTLTQKVYPITKEPHASSKFSLVVSLWSWLAQMVQADWLLFLNLD